MVFKRKSIEPKARAGRNVSRAPITAYYRSKAQPGAASPFKSKQPKKNYRKWVLGVADIVLIILLLAGLIYSLLLKPVPKVTATNLSYHPAQVYSSAVAKSFSGLKNSNKISFDEPAVIKNIQKQFPEVEAVHIELPFFSQEARVRLVVSPPAFKLASGTQSLIIDSSGLAVARSSDLPAFNLLSLTDQSGFEAGIGKQVLSSQSVEFIRMVIAQSRRAKVPIASMTLPALAQEVDLRTADQPYYVKFYLDGDALNQTGQFLAARQQFTATHQQPSQYLDVRVSGKIFYK